MRRHLRAPVSISSMRAAVEDAHVAATDSMAAKTCVNMVYLWQAEWLAFL